MAQAAKKTCAEVLYFPPSAYHLIQPYHSFDVQKLKRVWTKH